MTESTELLAFSATLLNNEVPVLPTVSLTQPNKLLPSKPSFPSEAFSLVSNFDLESEFSDLYRFYNDAE